MKSSSRTTHPVLLFINLYFFSFQEPSFSFVFFHFAWGFYCSCSTLCRDDHHKEQLCFPNKEGAFSLHLLQQQHPSSRSDYFLTLPHHHPDRVAFFLLYRALLFIQGPALSNSFKTFFAFKLARSQNGNNPLCGRDISYTFPLDKIGGFRAIRCPLNVSLMKLMSVKCLINVA